ncbi:unnamed protein product [Parascedosporium putredinis]|uniref:Uncharacterized protein n=1 Tax=Parascedosporium putredinis TaxID=1442378 RepID=A0A9P1MCH0_9PEZI|nr:unnamed protein product [Parascedosporium putredinis]CAI7996535.1 unnamed protein product [Parascedosporium putredinis]
MARLYRSSSNHIGSSCRSYRHHNHNHNHPSAAKSAKIIQTPKQTPAAAPPTDVKLAREASATNLKRNRSHHDVARRNKSFDRLRALTSANKPRTGKRYTAVNQPRVQFELGIGRDDEDEDEDGDDDNDNEVDDDEWVDDNTGGANTPT